MDKIFNKPFAVNGARVAIPENGTENERVSFDKGFTQPYEVEAPSVDNPSGQGFNILRPEMNEALYQLSSACNFLAENIDKWIALTTENLNNITQKGRYFQAVQSQATNANSYPVNETGYLIVFDSINNNVTQFYKSAVTSKTFYRYKIGSVWGEWIENLTTDNAYTKGEVYTKGETEQTIARQIQLTTTKLTNYNNWSRVSVIAIGRAVDLVNEGWVEFKLKCNETGEESIAYRYYTSGGSRDATVAIQHNFTTPQWTTELTFSFVRTAGGSGWVSDMNLIGEFYHA